MVMACFLPLAFAMVLATFCSDFCNANVHRLPSGQYCVGDVDPGEGQVTLFEWHDDRRRETQPQPLLFMGPDYFPENVLLSRVRFSFLMSPSYESLHVYVFDELSDENEGWQLNDTLPGPSYIASYSSLFPSLGVAVWDVLTLGSIDASERTNISTFLLPVPACPGPNQLRIYSKVVQMVRRYMHFGMILFLVLHRSSRRRV